MYWLVSLPLLETADRTWNLLQNKTTYETDLSINYRFEIPELRVGTLDSLMVLSDDLVKVNALVESVVNKIRRQLYEMQGLVSLLRSSVHEKDVEFRLDCILSIFKIGNRFMNFTGRRHLHAFCKYRSSDILCHLAGKSSSTFTSIAVLNSDKSIDSCRDASDGELCNGCVLRGPPLHQGFALVLLLHFVLVFHLVVSP